MTPAAPPASASPQAATAERRAPTGGVTFVGSWRAPFDALWRGDHRVGGLPPGDPVGAARAGIESLESAGHPIWRQPRHKRIRIDESGIDPAPGGRDYSGSGVRPCHKRHCIPATPRFGAHASLGNPLAPPAGDGKPADPAGHHATCQFLGRHQPPSGSPAGTGDRQSRCGCKDGYRLSDPRILRHNCDIGGRCVIWH